MIEHKIQKLIEEALHANGGIYDKKFLNVPHMAEEFARNRGELAAAIRSARQTRDEYRNLQKQTINSPYVRDGNKMRVAAPQDYLTKEANYHDNNARAMSQTGEKRGGDRALERVKQMSDLNFRKGDLGKGRDRIENNPRVVSARRG